MDRKKSLKTLAVLCAGLLVVGILLKARWLLAFSLVLLVTGVLVPPAGRGIARAWLKLSEALGFVTSKILLTLVYYLLLFPLALLSGIFNADRLSLRRGGPALFQARNHPYEKKDLENPW